MSFEDKILVEGKRSLWSQLKNGHFLEEIEYGETLGIFNTSLGCFINLFYI